MSVGKYIAWKKDKGYDGDRDEIFRIFYVPETSTLPPSLDQIVMHKLRQTFVVAFLIINIITIYNPSQTTSISHNKKQISGVFEFDSRLRPLELEFRTVSLSLSLSYPKQHTVIAGTPTLS